MFVKNGIRGCVLLVLIGSAGLSDPVPPGFVEGHVKIFPLSDVNLADNGIGARMGAEAPYEKSKPLTIEAINPSTGDVIATYEMREKPRG